MWLIRASLRNPYMVAAFVLMIVVLGGLTLFVIAFDILPVSKSPAVQVLTYYPGMPASSVEKTITNRIERWVNQAPGARLVESRSVPGVSVVKVYFRDDIDPNEALTLVNSLALGALPNLPPNTLPPVALPFDATGTLPVGILTVRNPFMDDAKQKDIARINVRNMLGVIPGAIAPVVVGGRDRSVMLYLDPVKMEARNLVPMDVVSALRRGNLMLTPGTAYFAGEQLLLDSNSMVEKVEDLDDLPIYLGGKTSLYLKDVGKAHDGSAIQTSRVRIDGANEVFVPVYRQRGASSIGVVDRTVENIPAMESQLPKGTKLDFVMDQTVSVRLALWALLEEGAIGAILVSVMILMFLGNWRMTLIAATSIPLALLGSIIGLYASGNTINAMTLAGLALAIGPLVDDAIVELENNHRNYQLGKSRVRAALDGCGQVMVPVLVATCTTVIVLAPLGLMPGMGGYLFRPLAMAVAFAMVASFLLSRTMVPTLCAYFLPEEARGALNPSKPEVGGWFERLNTLFQSGLEKLSGQYLKMLDWSLSNRWIVIFLTILLFGVSMSLLGNIGKEFFPQVDAGQITLRLRAPSHFAIDSTENRVKVVETFIREMIPAADLEMVVSEIGLNPDWSAAYTTNAGQQDAILRIQLTPKRSHSSQEYAAILRREFHSRSDFNDLRADFDTGGMISTALNMGSSSPLDIEVEGGNQQDSANLARTIRDKVGAIGGAVDVRVRQRDDAPYLVLDVDRQKSAELGLSMEDVLTQVVVALNSSVSIHRNFWVDSQSGNQYFVGVQYPEDLNRRLDDVLALPVKGASQAMSVNLGTVVSPRRKSGEVEIHHSGLRRVSNVLVNTDGVDIGTLSKQVERKLAEIPVPEGMRVRLKGEYERMNESFGMLAGGLCLAALLVYLLQVTLFRSWIGPCVIMFTVPLGFIGVAWMLFLTGTTINTQSLMGVIFLVGIAVNNGVLLVDFANGLRVDGLDAREAIRQAASIRFRPILMTFLATVLALLPMALGTGRGNEANVPLARAVVGGLISSTCLTLILVPILYTLFVRKSPVVDPGLEMELSGRGL